MLKQIFASRNLGLINHCCLPFANFMSNFCSWLFLPVLIGTAMFFSLNAQANCSMADSDQAGFCVSEIELRAAKIQGHMKPDGSFFENQYVELIHVNLAGDKPEIKYISDYTIDNLKLIIGKKEFQISNANQHRSFKRAVLEFDNLDDNDFDFVNLSNIELTFSYSISFFQFLGDSISCVVNSFSTGVWGQSYSSCLNSVSVAYRGNSSKKQDIKQSFVNAAQALIDTENNSIKEMKDYWHSSLNKWMYQQRSRNLDVQQNAYVFVSSADEYINNGANLFEVTVQKILAKNILSNLQNDSKLTMMIKAFESKNCVDELINKVQFDNRSKRVSSGIKGYIVSIWKYGNDNFNQQAQLRPDEFNDANKNLDLEFQAFVFCNKYLCEFNFKKEARYKVFYKEETVEISLLIAIEHALTKTITSCKRGCSIQAHKVYELMDQFELFISNHHNDKPWLVVKYGSYGNAYAPSIDNES